MEEESGGLQSMGSQRAGHDSMPAPSLPGLGTAHWISLVILGALDLQGCWGEKSEIRASHCHKTFYPDSAIFSFFSCAI